MFILFDGLAAGEQEKLHPRAKDATAGSTKSHRILHGDSSGAPRRMDAGVDRDPAVRLPVARGKIFAAI
jgi:hypothetical protein